MIPKIIHYCWFGRGKMPELAEHCLASWRKFLPDYELKLWNEDSFDVNRLRFTRQAYERRKFAFVTDYVRLYALKSFGGIYMDTDVEVLRSLDDLLGLPGFIIPFVYVYNPALLIVDTPVLDTVWIVILATFAVVLMSMAVIGWFKGKLNPVFRLAMAVAAVLMFVPGIIFDVIGLGLGIVIIGFLVVTRRKAPSAV